MYGLGDCDIVVQPETVVLDLVAVLERDEVEFNLVE